MNVASLFEALQKEIKRRHYLLRLETLEQTPRLLKVRLHISPEVFVQVYRNDQYDTTNLALIHNGRRIYGRDQLGGNWHRHAGMQPNLHDKSQEGQKSVELAEFLDEIEVVLASSGLP